jgi:hypothetical protein
MKRVELRDLIKEELLLENNSRSALQNIIQFIQKESRTLSTDETHRLHNLLKDWINNGI